MMKKLLSLFCLSLLCACAQEAPYEPLSLDFAKARPILLKGEDLRIIDDTKDTPRWEPYIGHLFTPSLTDVVNQLIAQKIQTRGSIGHITLTIKDATLIEQPLEMDDSIASWFTRQQGSKYVGRVEVSLEAQAPDGSVAIASAYATHKTSLPEEATDAEKHKAYDIVLRGLMETLSTNLDRAIKDHMGHFLLLKSAPIYGTKVIKLAPSARSDSSTLPSWMIKK